MMAAQSQTSLRGVMHEAEPMSRHTSWRVGGPADHYFMPADIDDVATLLSQLSDDEPVMWLGLGSNLLVRDGGIRGTVIVTSGLLNDMALLNETTIRVEAGVSCAKVARQAARQDLTGAEFLAGIPGTMGGALAMNAGAFGGETWDIVSKVETIDRHGERHLRDKDEYQIAYRSVIGPKDEWFVAAYLDLQQGDAETAREQIKALLKRRGDTQPTQQPSCGSVFRNPPGDHAARLIESCGLKGECRGGACVSEKHANFIVNTGNATAADIESLIGFVKQQVEKQTGVRLQAEVHIVGEHL